LRRRRRKKRRRSEEPRERKAVKSSLIHKLQAYQVRVDIGVLSREGAIDAIDMGLGRVRGGMKCHLQLDSECNIRRQWGRRSATVALGAVAGAYSIRMSARLYEYAGWCTMN
jgi:hypothetical protein